MCNWLCAKAGRLCNSCDQGEYNRCTNTMEALNRVIREENSRCLRSPTTHFWHCAGKLSLPLIPLHNAKPALPDHNDEGLMGLSPNNPPQVQSRTMTIWSMTAPRLRRCHSSTSPLMATMMMTRQPQLVAEWLLGAMQKTHLPLFLAGWFMRAMPLLHQLLLLTCRSIGVVQQGREMLWPWVPTLTKKIPSVMAPRLIQAYLLCKNQPHFQFSDKGRKEWGGCRRRHLLAEMF